MFNKLNVIFLGWRFFLALISLSSILNAKPDLAWVNLNVRPDFKKKIIFVKCLQKWKVDKSDTTLHFLFSSNLKVDTVFLNEKVVPWNHRDDSLFIKIKPSDKEQTITFIYHGSPVVANNPPWDGGVIWKKSAGGRHWLTVAIQDKGAMVWWPAPARFDDRPDSAVVSCIYPGELFFKGNGRLIFDRKLSSGMRRTTWRVSYPINTYNITLNIGDYRHFSDTLVRKDGSKLSLDYYPLRKNLSAARRQFQQVRPMLDCYEDFFGRYPFQNDGFSVVEVPYAGMEHQGAIAYGNKYQDGYLGEDYSGIRIDFDFILIHETGHEWWGNSVTGINPIDSWHQEAFCTYAEYVYVKCRFGNRIAREYINEKKRFVENEYPILDGNNTGTDRYNKGALMLFTLEQLIGPETMSELLFRLAEEKKYSFFSTGQIIQWFSQKTSRNLEGFFKQYLERSDIPELEFWVETKNDQTNKHIANYRVRNAVEGFQMPVEFRQGKYLLGKVIATSQWQEFESYTHDIVPDLSGSYFKLILER